MTRTRNDTLDSGIITDGEDAVSADYNAEIKLAERGFHVLMERIAMKRMPGDALPSGDVFDLLNAAGEQLEIQALQNNDKKVSKRRMKKTTQQLVSAIESLTEWPEEPRLQVASLLVPTLRMVELVSVADNLLVALQQADSPGADVEEETATDLRITAADRTRSILDSGQWTPDLDDLLRELREMSAENPDDEGLLDTLKRGILFNATAGREHLLLEERRRLVAAEPLPKELAKALEKLPDDVIDSEFVRLGLHLVLADVVAAGLVPEKTSPKMTIAATLVAMLRLDEPGKIFKWKPPDYEDSIERRHEKRWKVRSLMYQFLPVRWTPAPREELPPYNTAKARERLEELRGVAWLMIDQLEPVRFVSEAFRYGDGGPDAMDLELVHDIIELWEEQSLVSAVEEFGRAYLEDEWHHEIPDAEVEDASVILPAAVTSDGEPLVLSTVVFDVTEGSSGEIVEHLDSADGFRREAGNEGDRWEWLGPSAGSDRVVADLVLDGDVLTVMTHSLARASRTNARLADELGDRIELKDIRTEQPSPEALAELGIEMVGEEGSETQQDDQKQVVHQVLEKHYRKWLDEALPAFGDLSPRDAVTDPMRRSEVIAHLVEAEEIWSELGLDRTEAS
jgi:hypothetical protein